MKSNSMFYQLTTAALCLAIGLAGSALAQEPAEGEVTGREISIVVEEGGKVPAQALDGLAAQELGASSAANLTFSVVDGQARLANDYGQMVDATTGGAIAHPGIIAGPHYDETFVQMLADGKPFGQPVRIGTIANGSLDQLLTKDVPAGSEALLARGSDYAVIDAGLLRSQAPAKPNQTLAGQYCATIVDKERDVYGYSRVLANECSDRSDEDAFAQAQSKIVASGENTQVIVYTYILAVFENAGYGGYSRNIYGTYGDCDFYGYVVHTDTILGPHLWDVGWWKHRVSSTQGNGHGCRKIRYRRWNDSPYIWNGLRALPDWYVGSYYNDNIAVINVVNR